MCGCGIKIQNNATGVATNTFYNVNGQFDEARVVDANNFPLTFNDLADLSFVGDSVAGTDLAVSGFEDVNIAATVEANVLVGTDGVTVVADKTTIADATEVEVLGPLVEIGEVAGDVTLLGYPNTRDDDATVTNFLGTSATGVIVSMPLADIETIISDAITAATPAIQRGSVALTTTEQAVVFSTPAANADYGLFVTVRNVTDTNPTTIAFVVSAKSATGFTVEFSSIPTANYVMDWFIYP